MEIHQIGFGNLPRLINEIQPVQNGIVKETYSIVIPSTMEPGTYTFFVSLDDNYQTMPDPDINISTVIKEIIIQ